MFGAIANGKMKIVMIDHYYVFNGISEINTQLATFSVVGA